MKKTPLRRKKRIRAKSAKQRVKEAKDRELKPLLMDRDGGCVMRDSPFGKCGGALAAAHVYPKGTYAAMRHNTNNLMILCYRHHMHVWHKNPIEVSDWFRATYPDRAILLATLKNL